MNRSGGVGRSSDMGAVIAGSSSATSCVAAWVWRFGGGGGGWTSTSYGGSQGGGGGMLGGGGRF